MQKKVFERVVSKKMENTRLDMYLVSGGIGLSRSQTEKLIREGKVLVNGKKSKPGYRIKEGDHIYAEFVVYEPIKLVAQDLPVPVIYEDDDIIVINKPKGLVVHPAKGNATGTLVNFLLAKYKKLPTSEQKQRPGIVHRLDKDTTGLLVVAKSKRALLSLSRQLEDKTAKRTYIAFVWGSVPMDEGTIDAPIGRHPVERTKMAVTFFNSRNAITHFRVIRRYGSLATKLEINLKTGRTHQIRVHMEHFGYPIIGDEVYSGRDSRKILHIVPAELKTHVVNILKIIDRQALHAAALTFFHPGLGRKVTFESELPDDMKELEEYLEKIPV